MMQRRAILLLVFVLWAVPPGIACALDRTHLALIVNTRDPLSVAIGDYYAEARGILFQNVIRIAFEPGRKSLTREEFRQIQAQVDSQTLAHVQAYALTWAAPYRIECMSITAAFAFGFDSAFCAEGCKPTRRNPYFNSTSHLPYTRLRMRPTMTVAASSLEHARALIDRGMEADGSRPSGTAYLLSTSDRRRNVRAPGYPQAEAIAQGRIRVRRITSDAIRDETDVLFYFTGMALVDGLETLRFVPGAVADHLTSTGGQLTDSAQMSALRWLEAGATGSYGTVVEPCSFPEKFPLPAVLIGHYLNGDTLIEAYWKSVLMPGQGIFIGDPLAAPFRGSQ